MWYQNLSEIKVINALYDEIPPLKDVGVSAVYYNFELEELGFSFFMPQYTKTPPSTWRVDEDQNVKNTVKVWLVFQQVKIIVFERKNEGHIRASIDIRKGADSFITISMKGDISLSALAKNGRVSSAENCPLWIESS